VIGVSGTDYLIDQGGLKGFKVLKSFSFNPKAYMVYISSPNALRVYSKFYNIANGFKNAVKILGSEEVFLIRGGAIIASVQTGNSLNKVLGLNLNNNPGLNKTIKALRDKGFIVKVLFECKTIVFERSAP